MANGFVTSSPTSQYGTSSSYSLGNNDAGAQKYTAPAGTLNITEIGSYLNPNNVTGNVRFSVWTHDAVNDCPLAMVVETASIPYSGVTVTKYYGAVSAQITGGDTYWIAVENDAGTIYEDAKAGSGLMLWWVQTGITFPTWPTNAQWHPGGGSYTTIDMGYYAVYNTASVTETVTSFFVV